MELLYPLLKRFHRVTLVWISMFALIQQVDMKQQVNMKQVDMKQQVDIDRICQNFQLILSSDHRRKFDLEISPGSKYYF